jgi:hypothetical protein
LAVCSNSFTYGFTFSSCQGSKASRLFARRQKAKSSKTVKVSRPQQFYDAIQDAQGIAKDEPPKQEEQTTPTPVNPDELKAEADRQERMREAEERMEQRPELSTMIVDEETGNEIVAQGKSIMDVVTRKAVRLLGKEHRLAQMFPGVPMETRNKYRVDYATVTVEDLIEQLRDACSVTLPDGTRGIPPHPSVASKAIDYVLANRDYLGRRMKATLARITMKAAAEGRVQEMKELKKLWKNYLTIENHISAPFRQMMQNAEGRCGPNFGVLDLMSFCNGSVDERVANYLVLKGMVAHWEKKVKDADYIEKTPQEKDNYITVLAHGDPKRYLPDPPILFTLRECTQVCLMAQQMTKQFVETPELMADFPPEVAFVEAALSIRGGTPLRKFVVDDFCPAQSITPEGLREGVRRLLAQLDSMQIDPYGDLTNLVERLVIAMSKGTDDDRDIYSRYVANKDKNGPGAFPTYTFDHDQVSMVRFLDAQYEREQAENQIPSIESVFNMGDGMVLPSIENIFNMDDGTARKDLRQEPSASVDTTYKVPELRAAGRPHMLGWLDVLHEEDNDPNMRLGKMPPGRIIMED